MATGKSLEKAPERMLRVWTGKDGQPLRRAVPKIKASKKQRRKARALAKAIEEAQKAQKAKEGSGDEA